MKDSDSSDIHAGKILYTGDSARPFKPNWLTIFFMVPVLVLGLTAWPLYLAWGGDVHYSEVLVAVAMFFIGVIGVDVGYHRGFSHRSFRMTPVLKWITVFAGSSTCEGSVLAWCADHRRHHRFQDTEKDPYNVRRSFWWAHMGWMLGSPSTTDYSNCPDLQRDAFLRFQDRHYIWWLIATCFVLPLAIGFLIGRPLQTFLLAGITRLMLVQQVTFMINSYAHYFGRRPYSKEITARDSFILAVLASGEGWHNFHHRFPFDYRNGHRFFHWDPAKWVIMLSHYTGLAYDLKKTPTCEIYRARIQAQMPSHAKESPQLERMTEALHEALRRWQSLQLQWNQLKKDGAHQLEDLRQGMREAQREFIILYRQWRMHIRTPAYARVRA